MVPFRWALAALAALLLLPAAAQAQQSIPVVRVSVSLPGQEPLPPGSSLNLQLQDITAGATGTVLVQESIDVGGRRSPITYDLRYNPVRIVPAGRYVVRAEVRVGSVVIYSTPTNAPVLTAGNPTSATLALQRTTNALPAGNAGLALPLAAALLAAAGLAALLRRRLA